MNIWIFSVYVGLHIYIYVDFRAFGKLFTKTRLFGQNPKKFRACGAKMKALVAFPPPKISSLHNYIYIIM